MALSRSLAVSLFVACALVVGCERSFTLASGGAGGGAQSTTSVSVSTTTGASVVTSTGANMPATCDAKYGGLSGYVFCAVTADSCDFNVNTDTAGACSAACAAHGGSCITAFDNETACTLKSSTPLACNDASFATTLCRCSLP